MFPSPFPPNIQFCCLEQSDFSDDFIHEDEKNHIQSARSLVRQRDFLLGRACAHHALSAFQLGHVPILKNEKNAPLWPPSMVGSITHTENWAAAAVGKLEHVQGIGIDLENLNRTVHKHLQKRICVPQECESLAQYPDQQATRLLKILFSAKESIFKCFDPFTEVYLHFQDAQIVFDPHSSCFEFRLLKDCGSNFPRGFEHHGSYQILQNLVLTAVWVSA